MSDILLVSPKTYQGYSDPSFGPRRIIGYFSLDCKRNYCNDFRGIKYVKNVRDKEVNYDLNLMMEEKIGKGEYNERLSKLLNFLLSNETRLNFSVVHTLKNVRFFTFRGTLSSVCKTPYENMGEWVIVAKLYKGAIYLCQLPKKNQNETEREKLMSSWGHKFEQFMQSDSSSSEPDLSKPCVETEEFNIIYQTFLNEHELVFGAESDGVSCETDTEKLAADMETEQVIEYLNSVAFVELKTSAITKTGKQKFNFRKYKSLRWWVQSHLVGVDKVVCGYRDDNGIVKELKSYSLADLVMEEFWSPKVCLNFLDRFLDFVKLSFEKEIIKKHGAMYVHDVQRLPIMSLTFEWKSHHPVQITACNEDILPEWFTNDYGKYAQCAQHSVDMKSNHPISDRQDIHGHSYEHSEVTQDRQERNDTRNADDMYGSDRYVTRDESYSHRQDEQERGSIRDVDNRYRQNRWDIVDNYRYGHRQSTYYRNRQSRRGHRPNYRYGRSFNRGKRGSGRRFT